MSVLANVYPVHRARAMGHRQPKVEDDPINYFNPRACYLTPTCTENLKNKLFNSPADWLDKDLGIKLSELTVNDTAADTPKTWRVVVATELMMVPLVVGGLKVV